VRPAGGGIFCAWLRCGRRKKTDGWAVRVSWADREAEAQWGRGENARLKRKKWAATGPKGQLAAGPIGLKVRKISFPNNNLIFEDTKSLEICRRRFRRNFDMRIFPKIF
jgi:hypothetical protein